MDPLQVLKENLEGVRERMRQACRPVRSARALVEVNVSGVAAGLPEEFRAG